MHQNHVQNYTEDQGHVLDGRTRIGDIGKNVGKYKGYNIKPYVLSKQTSRR